MQHIDIDEKLCEIWCGVYSDMRDTLQANGCDKSHPFVVPRLSFCLEGIYVDSDNNIVFQFVSGDTLLAEEVDDTFMYDAYRCLIAKFA